MNSKKLFKSKKQQKTGKEILPAMDYIGHTRIFILQFTD